MMKELLIFNQKNYYISKTIFYQYYELLRNENMGLNSPLNFHEPQLSITFKIN